MSRAGSARGEGRVFTVRLYGDAALTIDARAFRLWNAGGRQGDLKYQDAFRDLVKMDRETRDAMDRAIAAMEAGDTGAARDLLRRALDGVGGKQELVGRFRCVRCDRNYGAPWCWEHGDTTEPING